MGIAKIVKARFQHRGHRSVEAQDEQMNSRNLFTWMKHLSAQEFKNFAKSRCKGLRQLTYFNYRIRTLLLPA